MRTYFFGKPWPSGVCDIGVRAATPVGVPCLLCDVDIKPGDQGDFFATGEPKHRECSLRSVLGGIGHMENHEYWCIERRDPDGGRTYRQSAIEVWRRSHELFGREPVVWFNDDDRAGEDGP